MDVTLSTSEKIFVLLSGVLDMKSRWTGHIIGWMILISPKNNGKMLFGWMLYICSRYVLGKQQQGRKRLEEFHMTGHSKLLAVYNVISDKSYLFLATGFC